MSCRSYGDFGLLEQFVRKTWGLGPEDKLGFLCTVQGRDGAPCEPAHIVLMPAL